jgi:hypothetical protein
MSLPEATCEDLYAVLGPEAYAGLLEEALTGMSYADVLLPFPAPGSLGLRIDVRPGPEGPVSAASSNAPFSKGYVAVLGAIAGSQAERAIVQARLHLGASVTRENSAAIKMVNGRDVTYLTTDETIEMMKDQARPLLITLR